mmetsp:Transcript_24664/g.30756  ORF Transcript_24664/g.30756 Transcript_24664/m.30756 type:complete len:122 (+) Transcript_24664:398-763(+)
MQSLAEIIKESWTGNQVYKLKTDFSSGEFSQSSQSSESSKGQEIVLEIHIKKLKFNSRSSRLVLIRNVNYVIEQQRLKMRASYERRLTNTLSHELLTPLNCIINVTGNLKSESEGKLQKMG